MIYSHLKKIGPVRLSGMYFFQTCACRAYAAVIFSIALLLMFLSHDVLAEPDEESNEARVQNIERILVLPFCDISALIKQSNHILGPLSGKVFEIDRVEPQAVEIMNTFLDEQLEKVFSLKIEYPSSGITSDVAVLPASEGREARIASIRKIGRQEMVDAVLCGFIYAFRDRHGGDLSIEDPAKVVFEVNLVSVSTGALIWQEHFWETQKPLNEDLFQIKKFFRRGGKWVTARQMAQQALDDLFKTFPKPSIP